MNIQNPALYPPQQAYGYGGGMAQPPQMTTSYPNDPSQNHFQQSFPVTPQRPNQFQQPGAQIPPHLYQQFQQQQQQQQQHHHQQQQHPQSQQQPQPQSQQQQGSFGRPSSQGNGVVQGQRQSSGNGQAANIPRSNAPSTSSTQAPNMAMQQPMVNTAGQHAQAQNPNKSIPQSAQASPLSPQAISREKMRISLLLEINAHLLQEVVSLQSQGKAGQVQQSPTSPNSTTENFNSPIDANKPGPSKEYAECMRRLQANLSYLATAADAKKRNDGKIPAFPAILSPPPHLAEVHDLYKKLAAVFPEAAMSAASKAAALANAQNSQQPGQNATDGQMNPPLPPSQMMHAQGHG